MRDLIITLIVFTSIPYIFSKPYIGVLMWSWIGYMNPHRLSWGFAHNFPFAYIIAIVTSLAVLFSREKKSFPVNAITIVLILFIMVMIISTFFAIDSESAVKELTRVLKVQFVIFLTLMLMTDRKRIEQLVWVIFLSIGFFGIKGGVHAILSGGSTMIWGPPGSFISGNNELGLALLMVIPLGFYLRETLTNSKLKTLMMVFIALMFISVLSTYSRGAFLGVVMMLLFLWIKRKQKFITAIVVIIALIAGMSFMPEKYFERLQTIETYEEDNSAMGRINAWVVAINIANDRFFAGGFNHWSLETFAQYAPVPEDVHDAHSIYFEVLGEQGYLGLMLYLLFYFLSWRSASYIIKKTRDNEQLLWCNQLARMIQVSFVGYFTGGAFLGLAYWDLPYHLVAIIVLMRQIVEKSKNEPIRQKEITDVGMNDILVAEKKKWPWEQ